MTTDLHRRSPVCPSRQQTTGWADLGIVIASALLTRPAAPAFLTSPRPGRPTERRKINKRDLADTMTVHQTTTRTSRRTKTVAISIRSHPDQSLTPTTVTSGKPTNRPRIHVELISTGVPCDSGDLEHHQELQRSLTASGSPTRPSPHAQLRSAPKLRLRRHA